MAPAYVGPASQLNGYQDRGSLSAVDGAVNGDELLALEKSLVDGLPAAYWKTRSRPRHSGVLM
jgi:hypothetical protein